MRKNYLLVLLLSVCTLFNVKAQTDDQIINFPDEEFKKALLRVTQDQSKIDLNDDGEITIGEAKQAKIIDIRATPIVDTKGIEYFVNLETLRLENLPSLQGKLDISNNLEIRYLYCRNIGLTNLDVTKHIELTSLDCANNLLTNLDVSKNIKLISLGCSRNPLEGRLDVSNNLRLNSLSCSGIGLKDLDISKNVDLGSLSCGGNPLEGRLDISNNLRLSSLSCSGIGLKDLDITKHTNLGSLICSNNQLKDLDVSKNIRLRTLWIGNNQLKDLDVSKNINLSNFICSNNQLTSLDISNNTKLGTLWTHNNQLTSLDVSKNTNLTVLLCYRNQLTSLDVSKNINLSNLSCSENQLTDLDVSKNINLAQLSCGNNQLTSLDVRNCKLTRLYASSNPNLEFVYASGQKFGTQNNNLSFSVNSQGLKYVCVDAEYVAEVRRRVNTNVVVDTKCEYTPEEETYNIKGKGTYTNNGTNIALAHRFYSINNGTETTGFYGDSLGLYDVSLFKGDYTYAPKFENDYFTVNPGSVSASFPTDGKEVVRDFVATARGEFNDVEIIIVPVVRPRPGFQATYRIVYRNKGTTTQQGKIFFIYDGNFQTYDSSSPSGESLRNRVVFDYEDLQPFETRSITVTFTMNTPQDENPLIGVETLEYSALITLSGIDSNNEDNRIVLPQEVRNSWDPNDKTCLQGDSIQPNMVGKYLYYMIRFENTGTANAEKVVIKDSIDTNTFDITSLVPIEASHSFATVVKQNEVSFVFDKINLPFDDENNDGYVLFKIKTKDNLKKGDFIKNKAGIYFDFNDPVITNEATTVIAEKKITPPKPKTFEDYFVMYPNPARIYLKLEQKVEDIKIHDVRIYSKRTGLKLGYHLGCFSKSMFVGYLWPGVYILKVRTDKGEFTSSFVKKW